MQQRLDASRVGCGTHSVTWVYRERTAAGALRRTTPSCNSDWRCSAVPLAGNLPAVGVLSSMAAPSSEQSPVEGLGSSSNIVNADNRPSIDPQASGEDITVIHSPEELTRILEGNPDKLVCLMCKAKGCRPCKVFARKYQRIAAQYRDCLFLECTGDETVDLRKLMIEMGIRSTPTFRLYRRGECLKTHVGIDDQKLRNAVISCLEPQERKEQEEATNVN